jgi:hypothetical protein
MKKLLLCTMLVAVTPPAWSQTKPKAVAGRDPCAPIGQTASRELIYSMSCTNLPAPPPPPPVAEVVQPAPEPEVRRGGLFGMSFDVGGNAPGGQGRTP